MTLTSPHERVLDTFSVASEPGNERLALARVAEAVASRGLTADQLERLKTAVAEATMNAIEHGNHNDPGLAVDLSVVQTADGVAVSITDDGGFVDTSNEVELPDLAAKLVGAQSPRGWGLFLIEHMVDAMDVSTDGDKHTVRLTMRFEQARRHDPEGGSRAEQM